MKSILISKIHILSDEPFERIQSILRSGMSSRYRMFSETIMNGVLSDGRLKAVVNPPMGIADPFKSRVTGYIKDQDFQTEIILEVKPGWFVAVLCLMLLVFTTVSIFFQIELALGLFLFFIICFALGLLKMEWDKGRLAKWINNKIGTAQQRQ